MDDPYSIFGVHGSQHSCYTPETLFNETQAKYTTLLNQGLWQPSDKTPEEQTLAMVAQQQQTKKSSNNSTKSKSNSDQGSKAMEKDKKSPPFANKPGKLGDTKQWNGKTYYWCPANHKHSHWHMHKVEECNTYKKMLKEQEKSNNDDSAKKVTMDKDKLKKGMVAIFPSGDFNTDDLAEDLAATIAGAIAGAE